MTQVRIGKSVARTGGAHPSHVARLEWWQNKILTTMSWFRELAGDERPSQRIPSTASCFLDGRLGDSYQSATSPSMSGMHVIIQFHLPSTFLDSGKGEPFSACRVSLGRSANRLDHRQDACLDRFWQGRPSVDDRWQVGAELLLLHFNCYRICSRRVGKLCLPNVPECRDSTSSNPRQSGCAGRIAASRGAGFPVSRRWPVVVPRDRLFRPGRPAGRTVHAAGRAAARG